VVSSEERSGVKFEGSEGWVWVNRGAVEESSRRIAMRLGRASLLTDPERKRLIGDDEAGRMLFRPMRAPWRIPA
jgi:hypothetical protein